MKNESVGADRDLLAPGGSGTSGPADLLSEARAAIFQQPDHEWRFVDRSARDNAPEIIARLVERVERAEQEVGRLEHVWRNADERADRAEAETTRLRPMVELLLEARREGWYEEDRRWPEIEAIRAALGPPESPPNG